MSGANSVFSFKVLVAITVMVVLAHLVVLRASPMDRHASQGAPPLRTFITRSIEPATPTLATPSVTPTAATALEPPRQRARPDSTRRSPPSAAESPQPKLEVAPQAMNLIDEEKASSRAEDAVAQDPPRPDEDQLALAPRLPRPPREAALPAAAGKLPDSARLRYLVTANKFPYRLSAELQWQSTGEEYTARLEISGFGQARVQTSRGQITPQGLAPVRFADKYRSEVAAHFNRAQGKVTFSANTPDVPLLAGAQDRLSVLVQLGALVASAPGDYPRATTIAIQTIGPRDADTWLFTVGDVETLTLPGGEQAAVKLTRNPREPFDQKVELWLAPALGYLPARIRITETNGDEVDQQWLSTEPPA